MKTWLVACSKGGVGKTTLATQLAAQQALAGKPAVLVDADPQASATHWCQRRAEAAQPGPVSAVDGTRMTWRWRLPEGTQRVIVDSPAGSGARELDGFLDVADAVIVPVQPSALDMEASARFLEVLARHARVRKGQLPIGLVANRLKPHTSASQQALEQLRSWPFPLVAQLRDSQAYTVLTGLGKSVFDYNSAQVREHQADWVPLLRWLDRAGA